MVMGPDLYISRIQVHLDNLLYTFSTIPSQFIALYFYVLKLKKYLKPS